MQHSISNINPRHVFNSPRFGSKNFSAIQQAIHKGIETSQQAGEKHASVAEYFDIQGWFDQQKGQLIAAFGKFELAKGYRFKASLSKTMRDN